MKLRAEVLTTERLSLEPLRADDARELAPLLGDSRLYEHIGGPPPASEQELRERFARQAVRESPDGAAWWLNWVLRARTGGVAVGTFQATVGRGGVAAWGLAELAWVVGSAFQRAGFASEAALAVIAWLRAVGVESFVAHIGPANAVSAAVARRIGMRPSGVVREDGEMRWELGG